MRVTLVGVGNGEADSLEISRFPVVIGRGEESELLLDDRWVSRKHCRIDVDPKGALRVFDLQSRHGTYVNGKSVSEEQLHPGDVLTIGLTRFVTRFEESAACSVS